MTWVFPPLFQVVINNRQSPTALMLRKIPLSVLSSFRLYVSVSTVLFVSSLTLFNFKLVPKEEWKYQKLTELIFSL
jgi:hypothetical protein